MQREADREDLTKRQREVLERLELGYSVRKIATDVGVSRNAVYQTIERLRARGALAETFTASGQPPRRGEGGAPPARAAIPHAPRHSRLPELRAVAGKRAEEAGYAAAVEAAIAAGDAPALAYELGRADADGREDLPARLAEAALRRLGALDPADQTV